MSEKITFKQLVELISSQAEKSQDSTNSFLHELVQIIETGLRKKGAVSISGFGKFELRWMKERTGINPQTGEEITIPAQNKVVFKPYKSLREQVNRPYAKMEPQILDAVSEDDSDTENAAASEQPDPAKTEPEAKKPSESEEKEADDPFAAIIDRHNKGGADDSPGEADDEIVMERPKPEEPEQEAPEEGLLPDEPAKEEPGEEKPAAAPFAGIEETEDKITESEEQQDIPDLRGLSEDKELANKIKEAGSFNWSYAAAAIAAALLIAVLIFMMMRPGAPADDTIAIQETPPVQVTAPADQAVRTAESEADPPAVTVEPDTPPPDTGPDLFEYEVEQGESLWSIAEAAYGNPYMWPAIYQMNLDTIENPNRISTGQTIVIPSIQDADNLTSVEQEMIAEGYISIYNWTLSEQPDQSRYFLWAAGSFSPDVLDKYNDQVNAQHLAFARQR